MPYSVRNIADILQADVLLTNPDAVIEHLVTDSRRLVFPATSLFFAIQSRQRDGHNYVAEVYERGIRNFIVHKDFKTDGFKEANFIFADNSLSALQQIAAYHRKQFNYPVIGITGSNGKTIVKEWLNQLLSADYNIVRSPRSYNSQIGVPLSVWQMQANHDLAIFEAGISMPDEMEKLQPIIQPTIGVLTNIGEAHSENFINQSQKASEKVKLFEGVQQLCMGYDDVMATTAVGKMQHQPGQIAGWSFKNAEADLYMLSIQKTPTAAEIQARYQEGIITISIPFTDDASIYNAITCWLVCLKMGIEQKTIAERMLQLQAVDMRLQLLQGINNCSVINDSYSFDTGSLGVALDFLLQQQQQPQKTVILSDIPSAKNEAPYQMVAAMLQAKNMHRVIVIGEQWGLHYHLLQNKIPVTEYYQSTAAFLETFSANHFKNEAVLLKGGRVFSFEKITALLEKKVHQTILEINLNALVHNLKYYQQQLQPGVKLMAMVKAFAYGSGSVEVAKVLQFHKTDYLAVAYADEGIELRKAGISLPIMVMNIDEEAFETLVQHNLEPELFSINMLTSFMAFLQKQGLHQYPVHIKLDTGMHRLGIDENDIAALLQNLSNNTHLAVQSVFSHFASGEDVADDAFTNQQAALFATWCSNIEATLGYAVLKHISNSAAIFRHPHFQYNMVRLGIGLYGVDSAVENQSALQTVATLKTTIAQLRKVKAGATVGYNRRGKITKDSLIATLRIGYADGFRRQMSNGAGKVYIKGQLAPVIGTVAMDMMMVDVTHIPGIEEGEEVEIFGRHIPVQQVAAASGTIAYDILTGISQRVKRVYIEE